MTLRYFHGTVADLSPGDPVLTGEQVGRSNHGLPHQSRHVYATSGSGGAAQQHAISEAEGWAANAADAYCDGTGCGLDITTEFQPHFDAWEHGEVLPCTRVYEVAPTPGAVVDTDPSSDVRHGGTRMSAAVVVGRVL